MCSAPRIFKYLKCGKNASVTLRFRKIYETSFISIFYSLFIICIIFLTIFSDCTSTLNVFQKLQYHVLMRHPPIVSSISDELISDNSVDSLFLGYITLAFWGVTKRWGCHHPSWRPDKLDIIRIEGVFIHKS